MLVRVGLLYLATLLASSAAFPQTGARLTQEPSPAHGVEVGTPIIQTHSDKEYKDFGQVWTIAQDKAGLIYIGVSAGDILQYDGVN